MDSDNRICFALPYFGKLPPYFGLFLKSLEGKRFDVMFFSDLEVGAHPENFKIVKMSFAEFRNLAQDKLGEPVTLDTLIKCCDFKPMYGKIFEDYLGAYDYWMFGDCDVVYGNRFNDLLKRIERERYDVSTVKTKWVSGACTIMRNVPVCNELFMRARNWQEMVRESGTNNWWDECGGFWHVPLATGEMTMADCERIRDSFAAVVFRAKDLKVYREDLLTECYLKGRTVAYRRDGELMLDGSPIAIFHYVCAKRLACFVYCNVPYGQIDSCLIDEAGFYCSSCQQAFRPFLRLARKVRAAMREQGPLGAVTWYLGRRLRK